MNFSERDIMNKIDDLRDQYLFDVDYATDAVCLSMREVFSLLRATDRYERLIAVDLLIDAVRTNLMPIDQLRSEAIELLEEEYYDENPSERDSYAKQLSDAGHKESDF